jgi:hypothetical protein
MYVTIRKMNKLVTKEKQVTTQKHYTTLTLSKKLNFCHSLQNAHRKKSECSAFPAMYSMSQ